MPNTHRPISALDDVGKVVVDHSDLKTKGFQQKAWCGPVGGFGTIDGIVFENGSGQIELLFIGSPQDAPLGNLCAKPNETVIRPMIAQPAQPSRSIADDMPWIPDAPTLTAKNWTLVPLKDKQFDGTAIVSTASGTTTFVAFYRGTGQSADVCNT